MSEHRSEAEERSSNKQRVPRSEAPPKAAPMNAVTEDADAVANELDEALDTSHAVAARRLGGRLPSWLRGSSPVPIYIGVAITIAGFVLLLIAWGQVAGETQVSLQLPYLVSAGLTGLALVMVGLTVVTIASEQRDAAARDRQMDQLVSILDELNATLGAATDRRK